jgi:hypothetical protein
MKSVRRIRFKCFVMAVVMATCSFLALPALAADSSAQIATQGMTRYYNAAGAEVFGSPVLGSNAVVAVTKTLEGTNVENEFIVNLDVKTSVDISELKTGGDAAVVLVLDMSGSMGDFTADLIAAAKNFVNSYAASSSGSARYISYVMFETKARIELGWTDVSNPQNLAALIGLINSYRPTGGTNMDGGLLLTRNLLRTEGFPIGRDGKPIGNRSVVVFSDGLPNTRAITSDRDIVSTTAGTTMRGETQTGTEESLTITTADMVRNSTSFLAKSVRYDKYTPNVFTVTFGSYRDMYGFGPLPGVTAAWMRNNIATNSTFAYTAENASELNQAFQAVEQRIESWAQAWIVTDPMGANIEFATAIPPNDVSTGLLKFEDNTLSWDLRAAAPNSFINHVYTYTYKYRIKLDTASSGFVEGLPDPTNGRTLLDYVMVTNGNIVGDVLKADFAIPAFKGVLPKLAAVHTGDPANVTATGATIVDNSYVGITGNINFVGVQYSTSPTMAGQTTARAASVTNPFSIDLTGLAPDTTYYYRAGVGTSGGNLFGEVKSFTTAKPVVAASVYTGDPANVTATGATIVDNSYVGITGNINFVAVQYSTSPAMANPTTVRAASVTNPFDIVLTGLAPNTTY